MSIHGRLNIGNDFRILTLFFLQDKHFAFIYCIEDLALHGKRKEWESCYEKLGLNATLVDDCYRSERGNEVSVIEAESGTKMNV